MEMEMIEKNNNQINANIMKTKDIIGIIIIVVFAFLLFKSNNKYEELQGLNNANNQKIKTYRDNEGNFIAQITTYESQRVKDFLNFNAINDSLTLRLQEEIKKNKKLLDKQGSVTVIITKGEVETTTETEVTKDEQGEVVYKSKFDLDGWVFGNSIATKDSTSYNIGYKDEYSIVVGREPTGLLGLGKGKPFAQVTSKNPYNTIKDMRVYQVSLPARKTLSIGPSLNVGVDFTGKIYTTIGVSVQPEKLTLKI